MRRHLTLLAASSLALGALVAPSALTTAAATPAAPAAPTVAQRAAAGASTFVAAKPAVIHPATGDAYVAHAVQTGGRGLQYVPYDRTYRGLAVLGGDFVVVTDADGQVLATSAGRQQRALTLGTAAAVTPAAAAATARRQLAGGEVVSTRKVVDATTAAPAVAYESVVTGFHGAVPSRLHVVVDATTGRVRSSWDEVSEGTGTATYNGPNPVSITTSGAGASFAMSDPSRPGVSCRAFTSKAVLTGPRDVWGNGNAASVETGCVDALYDVQHEWSMLGSWLGRDGINGNGRGFPVYVGLDDTNAYWDGSGVNVGHNTDGQFITAQDVVGHEFGHAVDSTTPGGQSANGVSEATGDIFGTSLEFFSNQSPAFDAPDWTLGEEIDLEGDGRPLRNMADPTSVGDPVCYSSAIPTAETHAAAGPLDHWFYLLAGGQAAPGGSRVSRCTGQTVTGGLGVQQALTVFYNAMLAKTAGMTYPAYRTATLVAAKNLGGSDCSAFTTVKAAWDAIDVGAQPGDPTCTPGGGVTVADPGDRTATVGAAITRFTLTASPVGTYTWSATGLPPGVRIGAATGLVSGKPTVAGTFPVTATATGAAGSGSTTFTVTVGGTGGVCASPGQELVDPGFETTGGWTTTPGVIATSTSTRPARTGTHEAYLDGYGTGHTDTATQTVTIPAGCAVTVSFWLRVITSETSTATPYDTLTVRYGATTLATYSNLDHGSAYTQATFSVPATAGAQTLSFSGVEDKSLPTSFLVDDVAVTVS